MATTTLNTYEQVYNLREDPSLIAGVVSVICVLSQRGVLAAGFSKSKELLTLHYTGYNRTRPVWDIHFFEHLFAHEPLFSDKDKVKGIFVTSDRYLLTPSAIYDKAAAESWMKSIFLTDQSDIINHYQLKEASAWYLLALPVNITELIRINFKKGKILPMVQPHFTNPVKQGASVQCTLTPEQASVTLYNNGQLLWHKVFGYTTAEDIAYPVMQLCTEHNIAQAKVSVRCGAISAAEYNDINGLTQYFPGITTGTGGNLTRPWDAAIQLAKQLFSCV